MYGVNGVWYCTINTKLELNLMVPQTATYSAFNISYYPSNALLHLKYFSFHVLLSSRHSLVLFVLALNHDHLRI